jgi:hypothetical protein
MFFSKAPAAVPRRRAAQVLLTMGVVATTAVATAVPASAGYQVRSGSFAYPNGTYYVEISASSAYVSAHAHTSVAYSEAVLAIEMCSGANVCSVPPNTFAANRNYSTNDITTGNPTSYGHTYRACFSPTINGTTYSHLCTELTSP